MLSHQRGNSGVSFNDTLLSFGLRGGRTLHAVQYNFHKNTRGGRWRTLYSKAQYTFHKCRKKKIFNLESLETFISEVFFSIFEKYYSDFRALSFKI